MWVKIGEIERTLDQETETKFKSIFTISSQFYRKEILNLF